MTKNGLQSPAASAIIHLSRGYSSSVECDLPKVDRWVRLPLPAPCCENTIEAECKRFGFYSVFYFLRFFKGKVPESLQT